MSEPIDSVPVADDESVGVELERRRAAMHRRIRASRRAIAAGADGQSGWASQTRQPSSSTRSNVHWT
jgi:hypothetical protein